MKALPYVVAVLVVAALAAAYRPRPPEPVPVRELLARPAGYDGRTVTVRTAGFLPDGPRLVYRRFAGDPPVLVAVYAGQSYPAAVPPAVRGVFRAGPPHRIEDAEAVTAAP